MIGAVLVLVGVSAMVGVVSLIRRVRQEQREFDARLDEQRAADYERTQVEQSDGYVPIHELGV